ncbi:MAG TPA: asparagine synthase (glutamine-hydrolyzing) [Blastocatellia bacterium]|nr:asparagine synthase (glutamine-hydrolyzing) [Blastocatellia bacterium]
MCGIVAIHSYERLVDEDALARATRILRHRGPDDESIWLSPDRRTGLGHRRLSIIDLATGRQPVANETGSIRAVVNGEFYGFEEIRATLEGKGHHFQTKADSEILAHLYEEHGLDALRFLRGEFAFVLWDASRQSLIAARDRFGIKPLFYAETSERILFASEVKALFAAGVNREWDAESFYQQLFVFPHQDRTLFKGIKQVPPGCFIEIRGARPELRRYWDLDYPKADECSPVDESVAVERVRELLEDSVRARLRADVPVSGFLSGGIDSSAVLGFSSRFHDRPVRCFTVSFDDHDYDEMSVADRTASALGLPIEKVFVGPQETVRHFTDAVWHAETFGVNWHGIARYLLCRSIRDGGLKVALTGEGGDEMFAGYLQMRQDLQQAGRRAQGDLNEVERQLGFVPSWIQKLAASRVVFSLFLSEQPAWNPYARFVEQFRDSCQLQGRSRVHQSLYLWVRSVLLNYILYAERLEMAHAVETRLPLLDHHLFEYARTLPVDYLIRGATEKYIFREAARPVLTEEVYWRPKHPFLAPPALRKGAEALQAFVQDMLRSAAFRSIPFFDVAAVEAILDRLDRIPDAQRHNVDTALLMMISACVLQDKYRLSS